MHVLQSRLGPTLGPPSFRDDAFGRKVRSDQPCGSATLDCVTSTRARPGRGWLVTLEGPEGAGKTTQAAQLRDDLEAAGRRVLLVREPGGTNLGEAIRALLLESGGGEHAITPRADALLFNAARAQLVVEQIRPALAAGTTVLCSRFADSTLAYQGAGMGLPLEALRALEGFATGGLRPDLTLLLDLPVEIGLARKRGEETRFEADFDAAFHRRVRNGFLDLARAEPDRFAVIDATASPESVRDAIRVAVAARLGRDDGRSTPSDAMQVQRPSVSTEPNDLPVRITP
jgi:dTMP kinase